MATQAPTSGRDRQDGDTHLDTRQNLPLRSQPGDLCWLTLGITTAFRANERLAIKVGEVRQKRSYW